MPKIAPIFGLAGLALVFALQPSLAQQQFSTHAQITNNTPNCAWMTFYKKGLTGYSIFGSGWLHPKQTTHVNLQRSGRLKVRAEILESALCGKSQKKIDDIEYITDVRGDRLFIVKNGERNFQIRR